MHIQNDHISSASTNFLRLWKHYTLSPPPQPRLLVTFETAANYPHLQYQGQGTRFLSLLPKFLELDNLKTVHLSQPVSDEVIQGVTQFVQLESLSLNHCNLTTLPASIAQLQNLKQLELDYNPLIHFIEPIEKLSQLTKLKLNGCQLKVLPDGISKCKSLKSIELMSNLLEELPTCFTELEQLERIDLSFNNHLNTHQVIEILCQLPRLRVVHLNVPTLDLPKNFENLHHWHYLNVAIPDLTPEQSLQIAKCVSQPTELSLDTYQITRHLPCHISDEIGNFTGLKMLSISDKRIVYISPRIALLKQLSILHITNSNQLTTLPDIFDELPQLESLCLERLDILRHYPKSIYKSLSIKNLQLNNPKCPIDFKQLGQMIQLKNLTIYVNDLNDLEHLTGLENLESLFVFENKSIRYLPYKFRNLKKLKFFHLANCKSLSLPQALSALPILEYLHIGETALFENLQLPKSLRGLYVENSDVSMDLVLQWVSELPLLQDLTIAKVKAFKVDANILIINKLHKTTLPDIASNLLQLPLEWVLLDGQRIEYRQGDYEPYVSHAQHIASLQLPSDALKMKAFGLLLGVLDDSVGVPIQTNMIFYLFGTPTWADVATITRFLQEQGVAVTYDWQAATHIIMCESIELALFKDILLSSKPIFLEDFLKKWILSLEKPFLMDDAPNDATQNITHLLLSQEENYLELIVEMMAGGGLNRTLRSYLLPIHLKHPDVQLRTAAKQIFEKYSFAHLQQFVQAQVQYRQHSPIDWLYAHPDIDFFDAVTADKMLTWHEQHLPGDLMSLKLPNSIRLTEGLRRMSFLQEVSIREPALDFDYQYFIDLIKDLRITSIILESMPNAIDLEPFWKLPHLERLRTTTQKTGLALKMPRLLLAPLQDWYVEGFHVIGKFPTLHRDNKIFDDDLPF